MNYTVKSVYYLTSNRYLCVEFNTYFQSSTLEVHNMKILVAVKRVIDYNVKVRVKSDQSDVDLSNVKMAMNPFCEIAIEEAVRLKEKGGVDEIVVVSVGEAKAEEQIRSAMALGADRGILVTTESPASSLTVAKTLKAIVEKEQPNLIIMGKQAIDTDNNQTGQMLSALTGLAQGTFASQVSIDGDKLTVIREIDGGLQTLLLKMPALVTADLRLNEPRYAKLPDIMKAKRKPLEKLTLADLGVEQRQTVKAIKVAAPADRKAGIKVADVAALVDKLKNEAKVL